MNQPHSPRPPRSSHIRYIAAVLTAAGTLAAAGVSSALAQQPSTTAQPQTVHPADPRVPAQGADSAAVAATVDRFHGALAAGDSAAVKALLAADVVVLESGGAETRAEYLSHHLGGDIAFARAVTRERTTQRVRVQGDVAWSTSLNEARGEYRGRAVHATTAELMVLVRTNGAWKITAIHWSSRPVRP